MEKWVHVSGYKGIYEVSNLGNVRSVDYKHVILKKLRSGDTKLVEVKNKSRVIKQQTHNGYKKVSLGKRMNRKTYSVHRIVYLSFNKKPLIWEGWKGRNCVCHINDIRDDNRLDNLFIGSQKENVEDMIKKGRIRKVKKEHTQKMVLKACKIDFSIAEMIRKDYKKTKSIYITGSKFNISYATVSRIKNNIIWKSEYWTGGTSRNANKQE